ncbi:hypothetical protein GC209_16200 [bacterium]|nr:hypothetical protein [bacterium]
MPPLAPILLVALGTGAGLAALPARAEDPSQPNIAALHGSEGAAARLIEAHRLHALGLAAQDPVLVLAAARLMQGVTLHEVARQPAAPVAEPKPAEKTRKKKQKAAASDSVADPAPDVGPPATVPDPMQSAPLPGALDPHAMMEEARAMLPEGELLRDVIADAEGEIPPPGPVAEVTALTQPAQAETTFTLALAGDTYSEIGLLRLGPGHLTLRVTDAAGFPVCQDASAGPAALCGVVPRESDHFLVTITNDGTEAAPYLLITN